MANHDRRYDILEAAPVVPEAEYLEHMTAFVESFVVAAKKERWHYLLGERPRRLGRDSGKLHHDLDPRRCGPVKIIREIADDRSGVYFWFGDDPRRLPMAEARDAADGRDAIFSVVPGTLAVYFFHHDETVVCRS